MKLRVLLMYFMKMIPSLFHFIHVYSCITGDMIEEVHELQAKEVNQVRFFKEYKILWQSTCTDVTYVIIIPI